MKNFFFAAALAAIFLLGCREIYRDSGYSLALPEVPPQWLSILGAPRWRIEWISPEGEKMSLETAGGRPEIKLPQTWTNAVLAQPYWPERGIACGIFKPAGALFPYDVQGGSITLTWRGGVDAVLYWELNAANAAEKDSQPAVPRLPQNFNWPRFRTLYSDSSVNEAVRADPWLADWRSIAGKIVSSGFDKRRLVPEAREEMNLPVHAGVWLGTSPFAAALVFDDANNAAFPVRDAVDVWVSESGMLRCNRRAWMFLAWDNP
jgi:hypothetical protein